MTVELIPGIYKAHHPDAESDFLLSVIKDKTGALLAVKAYKAGSRRPSIENHYLLTDIIKDWICEMTLEQIE